MTEDVRIERLDNKHNRKLFDCGVDALNIYLQNQAGQEVKKFISSTYVAVSKKEDSTEVMGFYTLSAAQIEFTGLPNEIAQSLPRYPFLPAYRIGRLAVNIKYKGMGIGKKLLIDALLKCYNNEIRGFSVIVDATNEKVISFYTKYGFIQFPNQPLKLFMPMKVIRNLFAE